MRRKEASGTDVNVTAASRVDLQITRGRSAFMAHLWLGWLFSHEKFAGEKTKLQEKALREVFVVPQIAGR